jgi:predicted dehydrogenase
MQINDKHPRRDFLKRSAGVALGLAGAPAIASSQNASQKIRVGFIGVGNRGTELLQRFMTQPEVQVAALCDVYEPYLMRDHSKVLPSLKDSLGGKIPPLDEDFGPEVKRYKDFRKLLEQRDIDAVVIATPDHWHALTTLLACDAGKDVYVEKPLTIAGFEGPLMIKAAKRTNRLVQVGLQRRSSDVFARLAREVQGGRIGKVTVARAYRISNMMTEGIGRYDAAQPPAGLDWDMWLGPRPKRVYQENIAPYKFRWWKQYSSQVGNWGVHYFDFIRWIIGEEAPASISAHGGRFAVNDDRTVPDTFETTFEFATGRLLVFGQYEASGGRAIVKGEVELRGTLGTIYSSHGSTENGYELVPSGNGQFQKGGPKTEAMEVNQHEGDASTRHIRNFLDCVKSRKEPNCSLEKGHRSTMFAHLASIAWETKSRLNWDSQKEQFIDNPAANALLRYEYRAPWDQVLKRYL